MFTVYALDGFDLTFCRYFYYICKVDTQAKKTHILKYLNYNYYLNLSSHLVQLSEDLCHIKINVLEL